MKSILNFEMHNGVKIVMGMWSSETRDYNFEAFDSLQKIKLHAKTKRHFESSICLTSVTRAKLNDKMAFPA